MRFVLTSGTFADAVIEADTDGAAIGEAQRLMASREGDPRPNGLLRVIGDNGLAGRIVGTIEPQPYKRGEAAATSETDDPNATPGV